MLFNVLADVAEDNARLSARVVNAAHRTHNGIFDATGINSILPSPVKNITDSVFQANENIVLGIGEKSAAFLRAIDRKLDSGSAEYIESDKLADKEYYATESAGDAHGHSARPDRPDPRDHKYQPPLKKPVGHHIDLRDHCPPVYDQKHLGSCTSHAVAAAFEFDVMKQKLPEFSPSRLFLWYNTRAKLNLKDALKRNLGVSIRDAIQTLNAKENGICSEVDWKYEASSYNENTLLFDKNAKAAQKPPPEAILQGRGHTAEYKSIPVDDHLLLNLKHCLGEGFPFIFAVQTYDRLTYMIDSEFLGMKTNIARSKDGKHRHALLAVGYIEKKKAFIVRNSWGEDFGDRGYFYMPYDWLPICYDFWTILILSFVSTIHSPVTCGKDKGVDWEGLKAKKDGEKSLEYLKAFVEKVEKDFKPSPDPPSKDLISIF
ncbi:hypothetical protein V8C35DRAFT_329150 [Trichoderma chlorosporum]